MCMCHNCKVRTLGRDARVLRLGLGACPFPLGDPDAMSWVRGWTEEDAEYRESVEALEHQSMRERRVK